MDIAVDQQTSNENRKETLYSWLKTFKIIALEFIGYFNLTEEERVKAGIRSAHEGYDELYG